MDELDSPDDWCACRRLPTVRHARENQDSLVPLKDVGLLPGAAEGVIRTKAGVRRRGSQALAQRRILTSIQRRTTRNSRRPPPQPAIATPCRSGIRFAGRLSRGRAPRRLPATAQRAARRGRPMVLLRWAIPT